MKTEQVPNIEQYSDTRVKIKRLTIFFQFNHVLLLSIPLLIALLGFFLFHSQILQAAEGIHYVAPEGVDSALCSSAQPCLTIQQAITNAVSGDEIRVAAGTYDTLNQFESASQVVYLNKSVTLKGGFTTTNWLVADPIQNPTIVDAVNSGRGFYIPAPVTVRIVGFRILNGEIADDRGAGIYNKAGHLTVEECWIHDNEITTDGYTDAGGGIASGFVGEAGGTLLLQDSYIYSNTTAAAGGAIGIITGTAIIERNEIWDNTTGFGSISVFAGDVLLKNNWVYANEVTASGGGMAVLAGEVRDLNNSWYGNEADVSGGGLYQQGGTVTITNSLIISNTASSAGAIDSSGGAPLRGLHGFLR